MFATDTPVVDDEDDDEPSEAGPTPARAAVDTDDGRPPPAPVAPAPTARPTWPSPPPTRPDPDRPADQGPPGPDRRRRHDRGAVRRRLLAPQPAAGRPRRRALARRDRRCRRGALAGAGRHGHQAGAHLQRLRPGADRGRAGVRCGSSPAPTAPPATISDRVKDTWDLGPGWVTHVPRRARRRPPRRLLDRGGDTRLEHRPERPAACRRPRRPGGRPAQGVQVDHAVHRRRRGRDRRRGRPRRVHRHDHRPRRRARLAARHLLDKLGLAEPAVASRRRPRRRARAARRVRARLRLGPQGLTGLRRASRGAARRPLGLGPRGPRPRLGRRRSDREHSLRRSRRRRQAQAAWWLDRAQAREAHGPGRLLRGGRGDRRRAGVERRRRRGHRRCSRARSPRPSSADLLRGGATVVATTSGSTRSACASSASSTATTRRPAPPCGCSRPTWRRYADVDALVEWISEPEDETAGGQKTELRPGLAPTLLFPFAAPAVRARRPTPARVPRSSSAILLWSVERLVTGLAAKGADHRIGRRVHVVLPGSPNRGMFGGDGAYGEAKAALDAFVTRWHAEQDWAQRVTLAHALIGWVRGTGLMGDNDPLVEAVNAAGVRTWSPEEMATELLALCTAEAREKAAESPARDRPHRRPRRGRRRPRALAHEAREGRATARTSPTRPRTTPGAHPAAGWAQTSRRSTGPTIDGQARGPRGHRGRRRARPLGSARTRFEIEVEDDLSAAGVLELAWSTGLVVWETPARRRLVRRRDAVSS